MKVVLFCGGLGMRMRDGVTSGPKPMAMIGDRPLMWHVMRYYAHYGHTDFVLCLGYGASHVKDFFLNYDETRSNDFVLEGGDRQVKLFKTDIADWRITFVDTGQRSSIGERLRAVRTHLQGEEAFLANYSDGLSDLDLDAYLDYFRRRDKIATFLSVAAPHTFHIVRADADDHVEKMEAVGRSVVRINGGFFAFKQEIFDHMRDGEDLVLDPFDRLMAKRELLAYPFDGFWRNMDTLKDRQDLDELWSQGEAPWTRAGSTAKR